MSSALVTKHIAGLFNGVSQQAPTLRLETQAEEQINGWSSLVHGLTSRPPTKFVGNMPWGPNDIYHPIRRDDKEQYILSINASGVLTVADLEGHMMPIESSSEHEVYLSSVKPSTDLSMTTIADYTIVANKYQEIEMEAVNDNVTVQNAGKCKVTIGAIGTQTYSIIVDDVTIATAQGSYTTGDSENGYTTTNRGQLEVIQELREQVNLTSGYSATLVVGNYFYFVRTDGQDFVALTPNLTSAYTPASATELVYDNVAYVYVSKGVALQTYSVTINGAVVASYDSGTTSQAHTYKTDVIADNLYSAIMAQGYQCRIKGSVIKIWQPDGDDFEFDVHDSWGDLAIKGFKGSAQSFGDLPAKCFEGAILQITGKTSTDEGSYWVKYVTSYTQDGQLVETTGTWKESREPNKAHKFKSDTVPLQIVRRQNVSKYSTAINPYGLYFSVEACNWEDRKVGDATSAPAPSFVGRTINDIFLFANRLGVLTGTSVCLTRAGEFFNFFPATVTDSLDDDPIDMDVPASDVSNIYHALPSKDYLMLFSENSQYIMGSGGDPMSPVTANITPILKYPSTPDVEPLAIGQSAYFLSPRGNFMALREYFIQADGVLTDAPNVADHVPYYITNTKGMSMIGIPNEDILFISDGSKSLYTYKYNWAGDQKTQSSWSKWVFNRDIIHTFEFNNKLYIYFIGGKLEVIEFNYENLPLLDSVGGPTQYPYNFKYSFSPMFVKNGSGLGEIEGSSILRRLLLYFQKDSSFTITARNLPKDRDRITNTYMKRAGITEFVSKSFILRGDSKDTSVVIESNGTDPVSIQSASFELLVTNRARQM
jgi:hypothetical protein